MRFAFVSHTKVVGGHANSDYYFGVISHFLPMTSDHLKIYSDSIENDWTHNEQRTQNNNRIYELKIFLTLETRVETEKALLYIQHTHNRMWWMMEYESLKLYLSIISIVL